MVCCLNPNCSNPHNPDTAKFCQNCGVEIVRLLRNHYKVIKLLGQGGFGRTYLAQDIDKLDQPCVVKQLVPSIQGTWAKNKAVKLFKEEAQQLEQLGEHHHIPSLYAYFEQDNYLYLVQQFIEGQDLLKELKQQEVWQEAEIKQLLFELLPVLQFIHEKGIIHRDIKPENIMRRQSSTKMRKSGNFVLIDFGVSKQLSGTVMSKPGTLIGSQGYAPIEQMQGGEAYPASDLFSLGATCVHLLAKIHPFQLWAEDGYSWTKNWRNHLQGGISDELSRVIDKLLAKDVKQRYQLAREVIKDLQNPVVSSQSSTILIPPVASKVPSPSPSKPKPVNKPQRKQKKNTLPLSPGKLKFDKRFLTGFAIVLILFVSYSLDISFVRYAFDIVPDNPDPKTEDTLIPSVSWENATLLDTLTGHSDYVKSVVFSPNGKTLASSSKDKNIQLWDVETQAKIATLTGHSDYVNSIAFTLDGKTLASGSGDDTIKLWHVETQSEIATLTGHSSAVISIAFSSDGKTLASGSNDKTIKLWDWNAVRPFLGIQMVKLTPKLREQINQDPKINFKISVEEGVLIPKVVPDSPANQAGLKAGDVLIGIEGNKVTDTSEAIKRIERTKVGSNLALELIRSESKINVTVKTGTRRRGIVTFTKHSDSVYSVAFSPDGKTLASGSNDNTIKLWHVETPTEEIATLSGHSNFVYSVAFSPDGKTLASGSLDNTIKLWDVETQSEIATLTGHSSAVISIAFTPDGKTLASGSSDETIKLWDVETQAEIATLSGHSDAVYSVAFSPDGKTLASGASDNTIKLWRVP